MGEGERVRHLVEQIEAGQFDALEAVADRWAASAGVGRMSAAIASVFEQHASQEIMDRFREKVAALMHLAFVEGAAQGVLQVKPVLDADAATAIVHIAADGEVDYQVTEGARLLIVDERAPGDRVYEVTSRITADDVTALIGEDEVGSQHDDRHPVLAARVIAAQEGRSHLRLVDDGED